MDTSELAKAIVEFYEKLSAWEDGVVKGTGLTTAQNHTIEIVGHAGAIQMKDLAAKVGVTTGTLTVGVDRLEEKGLLKRVPNEADRRSFLIELTDEGMKVYQQHHAHHLELTGRLVDALTEEERAVLREAMRKAIEVM